MGTPRIPPPPKPHEWLSPNLTPTTIKTREEFESEAVWKGQILNTEIDRYTGKSVSGDCLNAVHYFDAEMVEIGYVMPWNDIGIVFPKGRHWHIDIWESLTVTEIRKAS